MMLGPRLFSFPKLARNLLVESRTNPKFPVTPNLKRCTDEFLFAMSRRIKIFRPNRYVNASYEWPILEQFMGKCCSTFFSPRQSFKVEAFCQWWCDFKQHNTNQKTHVNQLIENKFCSSPVCKAIWLRLRQRWDFVEAGIKETMCWFEVCMLSSWNIITK